MIEKGRKLGLEKESRISEVCQEYVETGTHFIFQCPELDRAKRNLFSKQRNSMYQNFNKLDVPNKFTFLMSIEDYRGMQNSDS